MFVFVLRYREVGGMGGGDGGSACFGLRTNQEILRITRSVSTAS